MNEGQKISFNDFIKISKPENNNLSHVVPITERQIRRVKPSVINSRYKSRQVFEDEFDSKQ